MNLLDHGTCGVNDAIAAPLSIKHYMFRCAMGPDEQRRARTIAEGFNLSDARSLNLADNIIIVHDISEHLDSVALSGCVKGGFNSAPHAKTKAR